MGTGFRLPEYVAEVPLARTEFRRQSDGALLFICATHSGRTS